MTDETFRKLFDVVTRDGLTIAAEHPIKGVLNNMYKLYVLTNSQTNNEWAFIGSSYSATSASAAVFSFLQINMSDGRKQYQYIKEKVTHENYIFRH